MATKKILIQVILDDKASASNKKIGNALGKTTGEFKKMTAEQEKQYIAQQKGIIQNQLYTGSLKQQALRQVDVAEATGNARAQSGLNNAILLETGRLASDASYGFTAMANNLGQIVSLFGSFIRTNDGVVDSFKQLIRSLWGTGGLLIGIQLLIAFGPKIFKFFKDLIGFGNELKEAFDDINSSIGNSTGRFEIYIRTLQDATKSQQEQKDAIAALNKEFPEYMSKLDLAGVSIEDVKNKTQSSLEVNKLQREEIKKLAMARAAQSKIEENSANLLQILIDKEIAVRDAVIEKQNEIDAQEERISYNKRIREKKVLGTATALEMAMVQQYETAFHKHNEEIIRIDEKIEKQKELYAIETDEEKKIKGRIDVLMKFTDIETEVIERKTVKIQELFRKGLETNELYLQGYTGQQIMAMEALDEGLEERNKRFDDLDRKNKKRQKALTLAEKTETQARLKIRESYFNSLDSLSKGLSALGSIDDNFKIAAIITEKASAIAKVILKTKETNQVISAAAKARSMLGDVTAIPTGRARRLSNNISAGVNIAGIVAAAAGGINAIKSKSSMSTSVSSAGEGGDAAEVQAPDFNVVGQGAGSQLAGIVSNQFGGALRAYVVSGDISSAQELDRKINTTATIG